MKKEFGRVLMRMGQAINNKGHLIFWKYANDEERRLFYRDFIEQLAVHLAGNDPLFNSTLTAIAEESRHDDEVLGNSDVGGSQFH